MASFPSGGSQSRPGVAKPALSALLALSLCVSAAPAARAAVPFADVPPWSWAYGAVRHLQAEGLVNGFPTSERGLAENAVEQVFAGFAHASANGAQAWVQRFTYDRPGDWPAPLERSSVASYTLSDMRATISDRKGTATFTARIRRRSGALLTRRVRARLAFNGKDWQVDYADLAARIPVFR